MPVRTAIIPAAGLGTRFLPASKAVPKEMVTVVDRPIIQYGVEEAARAGICRVCIVTSQGKEALLSHFSPNPKLDSALSSSGRFDLLDRMQNLNSIAEVCSAVQDQPVGLGHAVWSARREVDGEPFVVLLPDELIDPGQDLLGTMAAAADQLGASVIAVAEVPNASIGSYGAIDPGAAYNTTLAVRGVVEKPEPHRAPSNLAIIGRYVLTPDVMEILEQLTPGAGGEIQLTDALAVLAGQGRLHAFIYRGRRWDAGTVRGYLEATVALALEHPEFGEQFKNYLETLREAVING
ncbi:MAG: UTP--glucose-1-phosphate uridylyltransferase [Actinomycetota bacterium]